MRRGDASPTQRVLEEFAGLVSELRDRAGVKVHLFEHGIGERAIAGVRAGAVHRSMGTVHTMGTGDAILGTSKAALRAWLAEHDTPDACFPNNWFSTHPAAELVGSQPGGTLCFYPMKVENRCL